MAVIKDVRPTAGNPRPVAKPVASAAKPPTAKPLVPAAKPLAAKPAAAPTKLPSLGIAGAGGLNKPGGLGIGPMGPMRADFGPVKPRAQGVPILQSARAANTKLNQALSQYGGSIGSSIQQELTQMGQEGQLSPFPQGGSGMLDPQLARQLWELMNK